MRISSQMRKRLKAPRWRLNNLYPIVTKSGERVIFKENTVQKILNDDKSKRKMSLKARQFGVSTNEIIKCLDHTIWNQNRTVCILAHDQTSIKKLFRIVTRAYKYMKPSFKPEVDRGGGSMYELFFPKINSRIYCGLESRGDTIHKLHVSEMAFMKNTDKVAATLQAVPLDGEVGIESTPFGMNHYHDMWVDKGQPYSKHFFPWYIHPEYRIPLERGEKILPLSDEEKAVVALAAERFKITISLAQIKWRRFKISEIKHLFYQEYPEDDATCFLTSGESVMDLRKLSEMKNGLPPGKKHDEHLTIYEDFSRENTYVMGADTAEGVGGDYSVGVVLNKKTRRPVAVLRGHIKPKDFADKLNELAEMYSGPRSKPLLAVERNNHGHAVLLWLENEHKYSNLFEHDDDRVGWKTTSVTRPILVDTFVDAVENGFMKLSDVNTINECMTLVEENGKIQAMKGKHDDSVIAHAIALQMCMTKTHYLEQMLRSGE